MLRPAVQPGLFSCVRIKPEPELSGDHHLFAERSEGFANEFFVDKWAVHFRSIEKRDASFDGCPDNRYHLLLVFSRTVAKLIPIQPRPIAETSRLLFPSLRFCILCSVQ